MKETVTISISLPPEVVEALKAAAARDRRSVSNYVRILIERDPDVFERVDQAKEVAS